MSSHVQGQGVVRAQEFSQAWGATVCTESQIECRTKRLNGLRVYGKRKKECRVDSAAFPHLKIEYPRRSQQRSGHSGWRLGSAMVTGNRSWRKYLCHMLLGIETSEEITIGFDNMEAVGNPNKRNVICTVVMETLSD